MEALAAATRLTGDPDDPLVRFPCLRYARASGKMEWLRDFPASPWHVAVPRRREHAAVRFVPLTRLPARPATRATEAPCPV